MPLLYKIKLTNNFKVNNILNESLPIITTV